MAMPEQQDNFRRDAWVLLGLGVLGRLPALGLSGQVPIPAYFDGSYLHAARDILHFSFPYFGIRVPVYPLLLALCGLNTRVIWILQALLGLAAGLMIYQMAFRRTRHALFSLLIGIFCSLAPEVLIYETSIMTETLTNFLLVASLWLMDRFAGEGKPGIWFPLGLGVLVALGGLTRVLMLCLAPVYFCFLIPLWPPAKLIGREAIKKTAAYALPVILLVFGWCGFVYHHTGFFSPTTHSGHNLMDQVDPLVDLAPQPYAALRDAWIKARLHSYSFPNKNLNPAFEEAVAEVQARTGKPKAQVWHEYQSLAFYLAFHHPLLYLRRAEQGWIQFWAEPTLDETEWPESSTVTPIELLMTLETFLVREVEAVFLILALVSIPCALLRVKAFTKQEYLIFIMVLWTSVFASFTEFGENRRFCVPFFMLIVYTLLTRVWVWINAAAGKEPAAASPEGA